MKKMLVVLLISMGTSSLVGCSEDVTAPVDTSCYVKDAYETQYKYGQSLFWVQTNDGGIYHVTQEEFNQWKDAGERDFPSCLQDRRSGKATP